MATYIIYGDAADAPITSSNAVFATARAGSGLSVGTVTATNSFLYNYLSAGTYLIRKLYLGFDTSVVGADTVQEATLSIYGNSANTSVMTVQVRLQDWGSAVETTDWVENDSGTFLASWTPGTWSTSSYNSFTSQSGFAGAVNTSGFTRMVAVDANVVNNVGNSDSTTIGVDFTMSDASGTTTDPKLTILSPNPTSSDRFLNPASDNAINSWTDQAAGTTNLYQAIDELSLDDADYIQSPAGATSSQYYETGLESYTDPALSTGHIAHYRYKSSSATDVVALQVDLMEGATSRKTWTHSAIATSFVTADQTLSGAEADSITAYNNLRLRFTPSVTGADPVVTDTGVSANSNAAVTTVDLVLTGLTVGHILVIHTAADNSGGGGAARTCTATNQSGTPMATSSPSITTYQNNFDPGAASAGTTNNVIVARIAATSGTVRLTYSGSVVQACRVFTISNIDQTIPVVDSGGATGTTTALATTTDASVASGNLIWAFESVEGPSSDTYTNDSDTTNGSWVATTKLGTSNATATDNQTIYSIYKLVTATGAQTYNPTINNARDSAAQHLEFARAAPTTSRAVVSWAQFELPAVASLSPRPWQPTRHHLIGR